jgi:hypothetical protein
MLASGDGKSCLYIIWGRKENLRDSQMVHVVVMGPIDGPFMTRILMLIQHWVISIGQIFTINRNYFVLFRVIF